MDIASAQFWVALAEIIGVNILLSGDNAVVIAMAARSLPPRQRQQAVFWGSGAAVVMRIVLTVVAVELLRMPYLKIVGALLLLWIGIQLLVPEDEADGGDAARRAASGLLVAVRTILVADLVMSLDNVIAVAAAAKGSVVLLVIGLLVSIPLVILGSTFLMKIMERWPVIITLGGALLGWVAGEMAATDPLVHDRVLASAPWLHSVLPVAGAALVVLIGKWMASREEAREALRPALDLAVPGDQTEAALPVVATEGPKLAFLLAADDSAASLRAVDGLVRQLAWYREPVELHLLNIQRPAPGDVGPFVDEAQLRNYHHERGLEVLKPAREKLDRAGVPYLVHIGVGAPANVISQYAREKQCRQIFLGVTEKGAIGTLLDTLATDVSQLVDVPVTMTR